MTEKHLNRGIRYNAAHNDCLRLLKSLEAKIADHLRAEIAPDSDVKCVRGFEMIIEASRKEMNAVVRKSAREANALFGKLLASIETENDTQGPY